jgi:hypothetical protein
MTDSPARRPVAIPALIGVVLLGLAVWFVLGTRAAPEVRECTALYHAARTAEDTTRVDLTVPDAAKQHAEQRSCGSLRTAGRWQ